VSCNREQQQREQDRESVPVVAACQRADAIGLLCPAHEHDGPRTNRAGDGANRDSPGGGPT
jgi:hypothetical protein